MKFDTDINPITDGYIKAFALIAEGQAKRAQKPSKRYDIQHAGTVVHAKHCISNETRAEITAILTRIQTAEGDERNDLFRELRGKPVQLVPLRAAILQDRSRYTGEKLREIRAAGGGAKERARAAKLRSDGGTVLKMAA